jgi:epsilon-lactone hydrolase
MSTNDACATRIDADGTAHVTRVVPVPRTVSPAAQQFLATPPWGGAKPAPPGTPMWELREAADAGLRTMGEMAQAHYGVSIEEMQIGGVRCHLVRPGSGAGRARGRVLINLHGGGFVMGSGSLVEAIPIAALTGIPVIAVDYRLAPEHPFPAAVDDVVGVYRELLGHREARAVGIYGASAGGFLTAQTAVRLEREGLPLPACLGVFTGGGDFGDFGDSAQIFGLSGFWGELITPLGDPKSEVRAYLGGADPADPLVSPLYADLSRFPPTLLVTGTRDALLSATCMLHRALRRAGAQAELFVFEAMPHAHWYSFHLPEAQEALAVMADFFTRHTVPVEA